MPAAAVVGAVTSRGLEDTQGHVVPHDERLEDAPSGVRPVVLDGGQHRRDHDRAGMVAAAEVVQFLGVCRHPVHQGGRGRGRSGPRAPDAGRAARAAEPPSRLAHRATLVRVNAGQGGPERVEEEELRVGHDRVG